MLLALEHVAEGREAAGCRRDPVERRAGRLGEARLAEAAVLAQRAEQRAHAVDESVGAVRPQDASVTKLKPNEPSLRDLAVVRRRLRLAAVGSSFAGPMIEPNASSRSPAPTLAATGATLSVIVDLTSPTVPAAKTPPPTASA